MTAPIDAIPSGADSANAVRSSLVELLGREKYGVDSSSVAIESGRILALDGEGLLEYAVHVWLREEFACCRFPEFSKFEGLAREAKASLMKEHALRFGGKFRDALAGDARTSERIMRWTIVEVCRGLHGILRDDDFRSDLARIKEGVGITSRRGDEEPSCSRRDLSALHKRLREADGDPRTKEIIECLYAIEFVTVALFQDISTRQLPDLQEMLRKITSATLSGQQGAVQAAGSSFSNLTASLLGN